MALKNIIGIDHAVVMVKDLDKAAENYRQLGFTISPRGTHSAHMGTGNYTIMFDPDYMELLGVLAKASSASRSLRSIPPPARRRSARAASRRSAPPISSGR